MSERTAGQPGQPAEQSAAARRYEEHRDRAGGRQAAQSRAGRDVGPIPPPEDLERKARLAARLADFALGYFPRRFPLPWCADHLKVIAKVERAVDAGGSFAVAMPRGSGKTTLCEVACLWALLTGRRRYVFLVGPDDDHAYRLHRSLRMELQTNDLLLADYPEACWPVRRLDGIAQRARGQLCDGRPTWLAWEAELTILPSVPGSKCSASVIQSSGLLGSILGQKQTTPTGEILRPDFVVVDDCQTRESARSRTQVAERLATVTQAVLGMAGPTSTMAAVMPCTVIRPNDVADQVLDPAKHPEWQGERCQALYAWPADREKWDEYFRLRREGNRTGAGPGEANAYYAAHREAMDLGAAVAWPERFRPGEVSGLQWVMNELCDKGREYVDAELQNRPRQADDGEAPHLVAGEVAEKLSGTPQGVVPVEATLLTAFVDVQQSVLFWMVVAWWQGFSGVVLDYGAWPDQRVRWFDLRSLTATLDELYKGQALEARLYAGLDACVNAIAGREWKRADGGSQRVSRLQIDANWGQSTETVYKLCRQSPHAAVLTPSHGRGITAAAAPISRYAAKEGEQLGAEWVISWRGGRGVRHLVYDTNHWKSFVEARVRTPEGAPGCLAFYGERPDEHQLLAEHCTAEYRVRTEGRGRRVDQWDLRPERPDNHFWDCLVGAAVAASVAGIQLGVGPAPAPAQPRRRVSYLEA